MEYDVFKNGSVWVRGDFHLHTRADKEFVYSGDDNYYNYSYVDALVKNQVRVGVICNHNKLDIEEFKALRKTALKKEVYLLPGAEIAISFGASGIHVIVVFGDEWLDDGGCYVKSLFSQLFANQNPSQIERENCTSPKSLIDLVNLLENQKKDYFLVFAHVEANKGLWNESNGTLLSDIGSKTDYKCVRERTLGFQKVRTENGTKDKKGREYVKQFLGEWYPAEVEGSDPKSIEEIGQGNECYLKIGDFSFAAVQFALSAKQARVAKEEYKCRHSYVENVEFEGGILDSKRIHLSPEMNALIGIRGSGKSAILESMRYALEIPLAENSSDHKYKDDLVGFCLGSGGKVTVNAIDRFGQNYQISRILNNNHSTITRDGIQCDGITIGETIIRKPLFFGQKELSNSGEGTQGELVEKLIGSELAEIRRSIAMKKANVLEAIHKMEKFDTIKEQIDEYTKEVNNNTAKLDAYKKYDLQKKLDKKLILDKDSKTVDVGIANLSSLIDEVRKYTRSSRFEGLGIDDYKSMYNQDLIDRYNEGLKQIISVSKSIEVSVDQIGQLLEQISKISEEFQKRKNSSAEEFASIQREITQLINDTSSQISSEEFIRINSKLEEARIRLANLRKIENAKEIESSGLISELTQLQGLWHKEFQIVQNRLDEIMNESDALSFEAVFRGQKDDYLDKVKGLFRGSSLREPNIREFTERYADNIEAFKDLDNASAIFGSNSQKFREWFRNNLEDFLPYQVPNKYVIKYHGKELHQHSLGQRASALILFVMSLQENDVVIIDQPEDDLDNQTIYNDVIKLLIKLKPCVQFIFATHNPNLPVLGDAEQVISCRFENGAVDTLVGSIDVKAVQETIVDVMEGGEEAFEKRKEIYRIWKS